MDQEKWADKAVVTSSSPEREEQIRSALLGPLPDFYRVADLAKTDEERLALDDSLAALNDFRRKLCDLPPVAFSSARMHVLDEAEFRKKISPVADGKAALGHLYVRRGLSRADFLRVLTHELVHAVSYLVLTMKDRPPISFARYGFLLADPVHGLRLPHFHGLNEAATETGAVMLRNIVVSNAARLDDEERKSLTGSTEYVTAVCLLDRLVARTAQPSGDTLGVMRLLFLDLFTGTDSFLAAVEEKTPGATAVLRATGARPDETAVAAEKLGFHAEAAAFRQLVAG